MITEHEIVSTRIIHAPRHIVFRAWEDPAILATWWGPEGFTNSFTEFDFSPSGNWIFTMHAPDGTDYPNTNIFENIVAPELIVFTHVEPVHRFRVTATFDEETADSTKLIFHMLFDSAEECARVKPFIRTANEQNFDRLEAAVHKMLVTH
ncbi:SRPBCC family protein [Ferruginibacter sp.]